MSVIALGGFNHDILFEAAAAHEAAVQFNNIAAAGTRVQSIDILGDQCEFGHARLELCQRLMSHVRRRLRNQAAAPLIPVPDQFGIAPKCRGIGQILGAKTRPQAGLGIAEGRHAALGGNAGARQDSNAACIAQRLNKLRRKWRWHIILITI